MMHLFATVLRRYERDILGARTRIHWIGNPIGVPKAVGERLVQLMEKTKCEDNFHLILAINYGGRDEVVRAAQRMAATVSSADLPKWTWKNFSSFLDTKDLPDIDLLIRTAGEQRLSNFMLLQMAYAEIFFTPCFWPDFNEKVFREALDFYATRQRRFGGIKNQCET
jgi:undecaprenyl diphosphate synthase